MNLYGQGGAYAMHSGYLPLLPGRPILPLSTILLPRPLRGFAPEHGATFLFIAPHSEHRGTVPCDFERCRVHAKSITTRHFFA